MDQNIFKLVSDLRKQVEELEQALLLERQSPRYTFFQFADYMGRGLTLQAAEIKSLMDEVGGDMMPHEIAEELDISLPQVLGSIDLLNELQLLGDDHQISFTTQLISSEDVEVDDFNPFAYNAAMKTMMGLDSDVPSTTEGKLVQFKKPSVDVKDMSDEDMLDRMIQAFYRAGEWPMRNRTNSSRWADRFMAIADSVGLPTPRKFSERFGSLSEAKNAADMLLNKRLLENETIESGDVFLVEDSEPGSQLDRMSELGLIKLFTRDD